MTKSKDYFLCYAFGRRGVCHAWGKGKTMQEALDQCQTAVRESHIEKPSKWRHAPYAFVVGHNEWWSLEENSIADRLRY